MTVFRKVNSTPPVRCSSQHSLFGLNQVSVRIFSFQYLDLLYCYWFFRCTCKSHCQGKNRHILCWITFFKRLIFVVVVVVLLSFFVLFCFFYNKYCNCRLVEVCVVFDNSIILISNIVTIHFQEFLPQLEDAGGTKGQLSSAFFCVPSHRGRAYFWKCASAFDVSAYLLPQISKS